MSAKRDLVFDIEAIPCDAMVEPLREYLSARMDGDQKMIEKMALYGWTAQVVVIAMWDTAAASGTVLYEHGRQFAKLPKGWSGESFTPGLDGCERSMLMRWWELAGSARDTRLVGFNSRRYDLPVLCQRSVVHDIDVSHSIAPYRYGGKDHVDISDILTGYGAARAFSLDAVCKAVGIDSPKVHGDGSAVEATYASGHNELNAEYCVRDVIAQAALFERIRNTVLARI